MLKQVLDFDRDVVGNLGKFPEYKKLRELLNAAERRILARAALVFAWSSLAKLVKQPDMASLGLPSWTADAVSITEGVLAMALFARPEIGGIGALAVLAGFTVFLVRRVNTGTGCACFGTTKVQAVRWIDIARNVGLLVVAGVAAFA